ncbi:STAS domain-containing protein [Neobacillus cucumis]|uniref:STAS domain-containing protein n=1 Tax=Neobacillus cucumis TaxID=1740721 RepID=UPI002852F5E8|nr:STAS domain-containing protein [Neobacillus cucumis]MDR4950009.1 STAS domain-containing protein [Neobacillus cucumis]
MNLSIDVHQKKEEVSVRLAGEIDAFTASSLREELLPLADGKNTTMIINLKDVSYLDSTGLGVFVGIFKKLKENGGELRLVELSERLRRLFEITGLDKIMNISVN